MKATLEFDLPNERIEFSLASRAWEVYSAVVEADGRLRSLLKHGDPDPETADLADEIRQILAPALEVGE